MADPRKAQRDEHMSARVAWESVSARGMKEALFPVRAVDPVFSFFGFDVLFIIFFGCVSPHRAEFT